MSPIDFSHREQSFAVRSWQDMFQKLRFELDEFETTRSSDRIMAARSYRALNLAWTAWHIHDWFFEDRIDAGDHNLLIVKSVFPDVDFAVKRRKRERLTLFGDQLASRFQALSICRTLATAGKHGEGGSEAHAETASPRCLPYPWNGRSAWSHLLGRTHPDGQHALGCPRPFHSSSGGLG
jgi:hypothetical protein